MKKNPPAPSFSGFQVAKPRRGHNGRGGPRHIRRLERRREVIFCPEFLPFRPVGCRSFESGVDPYPLARQRVLGEIRSWVTEIQSEASRWFVLVVGRLQDGAVRPLGVGWALGGGGALQWGRSCWKGLRSLNSTTASFSSEWLLSGAFWDWWLHKAAAVQGVCAFVRRGCDLH